MQHNLFWPFHGLVMATPASLRVSTEGQDLDQQRRAILDYARQHRRTVAAFVAMPRSSQHGDHERLADHPPALYQDPRPWRAENS
jgi:hypothetical protein